MTAPAAPDDRDQRVVALTAALYEQGWRKASVRVTGRNGGTMTVEVEAGEGAKAGKEWRAR